MIIGSLCDGYATREKTLLMALILLIFDITSTKVCGQVCGSFCIFIINLSFFFQGCIFTFVDYSPQRRTPKPLLLTYCGKILDIWNDYNNQEEKKMEQSIRVNLAHKLCWFSSCDGRLASVFILGVTWCQNDSLDGYSGAKSLQPCWESKTSWGVEALLTAKWKMTLW